MLQQGCVFITSLTSSCSASLNYQVSVLYVQVGSATSFLPFNGLFFFLAAVQQQPCSVRYECGLTCLDASKDVLCSILNGLSSCSLHQVRRSHYLGFRLRQMVPDCCKNTVSMLVNCSTSHLTLRGGPLGCFYSDQCRPKACPKYLAQTFPETPSVHFTLLLVINYLKGHPSTPGYDSRSRERRLS